MMPSVYGIGIYGVDVYKAKEHNKSTIYYKRWQSILQRCYDINCSGYENYGKIGITICEEWKNFQNFAEWWNINWKEYMNDQWDIDKDILNKNSKQYNPDNCIFIPAEINAVFTKRSSKRGLCPIGVSKKGKSFIAQINKDTKKIHLGSFESSEEAFNAYKIAKESHLKELANRYKDIISCKAYEALCEYKISIND